MSECGAEWCKMPNAVSAAMMSPTKAARVGTKYRVWPSVHLCSKPLQSKVKQPEPYNTTQPAITADDSGSGQKHGSEAGLRVAEGLGMLESMF